MSEAAAGAPLCLACPGDDGCPCGRRITARRAQGVPDGLPERLWDAGAKLMHSEDAAGRPASGLGRRGGTGFILVSATLAGPQRWLDFAVRSAGSGVDPKA